MTVNKKIFAYAICCVVAVSFMSGCKNYDSIGQSLNNVTIDNILPKVKIDADYPTLSSIEDYVYEQQLAACIMYADTYEKTYFRNFLDEDDLDIYDEDYRGGKVANMCTEKRQSINSDIEVEFAINVYRLLQGVKDCNNMDAYVIKAHSDVVEFYDSFSDYLNGDDLYKSLSDILLEFSDRSNFLAFRFLDENKEDVYEAALRRIKENAYSIEDLRACMVENNSIVTALNNVYDGVPQEYAAEITELNNHLGKNILMSMENISETDRQKLLEQLETATPSPSPSPSPTASPTSTPLPSAQATAAATVKPTQQPTQKPSPTQVPATAVPQPTEEPYEPIFRIE